MPRNGYLVISDISGYSKYLHESELDHARDSLSDLLNILVEHTRSPLRIVELEGDAVFSYAPGEEVDSAEILTGMVRDSYVTFRRALNLMVINTTCTCKACRLLPTLDLKFFIHYGSYAQQQVADHQKLVGKDVNLIHRLLKNSVLDETGFKAYAAYTEPAVGELRLDRDVEGFVSHTESYDDVGQVELCVKDMHGVWEASRDKLRVRVAQEDAMDVREAEFELRPDELWPYFTDPVTRSLFIQSDWQNLKVPPDGQLGPGATYVCAHGSARLLNTIVDWDPPKTYTFRGTTPIPMTTYLSTLELVPVSQGSRLRMIVAPHDGPLPFRTISGLMFRMMGQDLFEKGVHALRQRIRQDQEETLASGSQDHKV